MFNKTQQSAIADFHLNSGISILEFITSAKGAEVIVEKSTKGNPYVVYQGQPCVLALKKGRKAPNKGAKVNLAGIKARFNERVSLNGNAYTTIVFIAFMQ